MQKQSPVERFPGYVVLPDFLTLPQVLEFEESIGKVELIRQEQSISRSKIDAIQLPVILSIVTEWHIAGIEEKPAIERFPLTPRRETARLISWLIGEILGLYTGEIQIPNA